MVVRRRVQLTAVSLGGSKVRYLLQEGELEGRRMEEEEERRRRSRLEAKEGVGCVHEGCAMLLVVLWGERRLLRA